MQRAHLCEAADAAIAQVPVANGGQVALAAGVQAAIDPGQRAVPRAVQLLRRRQRPAEGA